jgi:hypothetical protein
MGMTLPVEKLYKEALHNQEFNREARDADPEGYYKPSLFSSNLAKTVYATCYYGWLVAKGRYKRENYY